jgi:hypothetical protein
MSHEREHTPYHERRLEQQMLDALLRIEELVGMLLSAVQDKGPLEEPEVGPDHTHKFTEPKPKGKRKAS